jgi:hypothetical protein
MKKVVIAILMMLLAGSASAQLGRYRQHEVTGGAAYGAGLNGFDKLENVITYNLYYSYWLNDTSSVDIGFNFLTSEYKVRTTKSGETKTNLPKWNMTVPMVGLRYRPAWDFFLDFGFGGGLGYEMWNTVPTSGLEARDGSGLFYYLVADVCYPIRPWLSVGAYFEPLYLPLKDNLEKEVTIGSNGKSHIEYDRLTNSVMLNTGVWVTIRIR